MTSARLLKPRIMSKTGYVFHELYMWHNAGSVQDISAFIQPTQHWEHPETKRRLHNLLSMSGVLDKLHHLRPQPATTDHLTRVHTPEYVKKVQDFSKDDSKGFHTVGGQATFAPGGYDIAALSAGGALTALRSVMSGECHNAYALVRPPGHHAESSEGMGFCLFNNVAVAAQYAIDHFGLQRVAIVDYDVHHGNGTQHIFESSDQVLFISLHQDSNYPLNSGSSDERGKDQGEGFTINIPLPPGSGKGAYQDAFKRVVTPALDAFQPELILVSSGFDPAYMDPLAAMMLSSEDFRWMTEQLMAAAEKHCSGKLVMLHEGGYSELYVPFCGLKVLEQLSGVDSGVKDPFLWEVSGWGYQDLQEHQHKAVDKAAAVVEVLQEKMKAKLKGTLPQAAANGAAKPVGQAERELAGV